MTQESNLPHVYYTVSELSMIKDVKTMKNVNVKTIGYIDDESAYEIDFKKPTCNRGTQNIKLDLGHIVTDVSSFKPCIVFGTLFTLNQCPIISVKTVKSLDANFSDLVIYHHQLVEIRKRNPSLEDLSENSGFLLNS